MLRTRIKALTTILVFLIVPGALFAFFDPFRLSVLANLTR
jgi:hypothetical protein